MGTSTQNNHNKKWSRKSPPTPPERSLVPHSAAGLTSPLRFLISSWLFPWSTDNCLQIHRESCWGNPSVKEALEIPTQDWNLFNEPHEKGREGGGCEWRIRDRQTDRHSANTRKRQTDRQTFCVSPGCFFFWFTSYFVFTSWFPLKYIARILWCLHVLFPLLSFCSLHVCRYWLGLRKLGSFVTDFKASIFLLCCQQGWTSFTNATNALSILTWVPHRLCSVWP